MCDFFLKIASTFSYYFKWVVIFFGHRIDSCKWIPRKFKHGLSLFHEAKSPNFCSKGIGSGRRRRCFCSEIPLLSVDAPNLSRSIRVTLWRWCFNPEELVPSKIFISAGVKVIKGEIILIEFVSVRWLGILCSRNFRDLLLGLLLSRSLTHTSETSALQYWYSPLCRMANTKNSTEIYDMQFSCFNDRIGEKTTQIHL